MHRWNPDADPVAWIEYAATRPVACGLTVPYDQVTRRAENTTCEECERSAPVTPPFKRVGEGFDTAREELAFRMRQAAHEETLPTWQAAEALAKECSRRAPAKHHLPGAHFAHFVSDRHIECVFQEDGTPELMNRLGWKPSSAQAAMNRASAAALGARLPRPEMKGPPR